MFSDVEVLNSETLPCVTTGEEDGRPQRSKLGKDVANFDCIISRNLRIHLATVVPE